VIRTLALDTTAHFGSIALLEGEDTREEILLHAPEGFGSILFDRIAGLLKRHGWDVDQIQCFASASGPGSFTGVRLGLTAVKGLAETTGAAVFGVSNLQAISACGIAELRAAVTDARRGEVYGAVYDSSLTVVQDERVLPFREWLDGLPDAVEFVSTDFGPFRAALTATRFSDARVTEQRAIAAAVGRIAARRFAAGERPDPAGVDANYVRRSDAELLFKAPK
jgi:tRNA threonylcarbamoyladenosine biosynthesis protein TsaB